MIAKEEIIQAVEQIKERLIQTSDSIHAFAELGNQEFQSAELLAGELEGAGFAVERAYAGIPTAFKARLQGKAKKPVVALLAEYDALPELGHACGHNIIGTAALGAALALARFLPQLPGTLLVFGTPAEETNGAKVTLAKEGHFAGIDAALMIHPGPETVVAAPSLAMDALEFHFQGRAAHAAAAPQEGINALDAVILTFNGINALRQHLEEGVRIHGYINKGGVAPNIVPEEAAARFYVRARTRRYLNQVVEKVVNCARGAALATGARLKVNNFEFSFDEMQTNSVLARVVEENLRLLGEELTPPRAGFGSLDMGNVSQVVPAVHPYISIGPPYPAPHTREFAAAAASPGGHHCLLTGTKLLAATAFDLFTNPALVREAQAAFRAQN
jgi:amidohydrolase